MRGSDPDFSSLYHLNQTDHSPRNHPRAYRKYALKSAKLELRGRKRKGTGHLNLEVLSPFFYEL
jgi:hypothetical protein